MPTSQIIFKFKMILALTFNTIRHIRWSEVLIPCMVTCLLCKTFRFLAVLLVFNMHIPEWLNQIYIVAHLWKEEILSFPMMCHTSKSVTCIKFYGSYNCSLTCKRKSALRINTISPVNIDRSTL